MAHSDETRNKAKTLYWLGNSYTRISEILGVSKATLSNWLKDVALPPSTVYLKNKRWKDGAVGRATNARVGRLEKLEEKYRVAASLGAEDAKSGDASLAFFSALYAGEGNKKGSFKFTNANASYVQFVNKVLREHYGVSPDIMKVVIQYHEGGLDYSSIVSYWSDLLGIEKANFTKPTCKSVHYVGNRKHQFGVCTLIVNDVFLRTRVMSTVDCYINGGEAEVVKQRVHIPCVVGSTPTATTNIED